MQMKREAQRPMSRRQFFAGCVGSALTLTAGPIVAKGRAVRTPYAQFSLVKEIKGSFCRAVSPDSRRFCLFSMRKPMGKFTLWGTGDQRKVEHESPSPFVLSIVETDSWKETYSSRLHGNPGGFSFFPAGDRLYGEVSVVVLPLVTHRCVLIDLRAGKLEEREEVYVSETAAYYTALRDRLLIGTKRDRGLVQVEWPDFREVLRIPVAGKLWRLAMTADRKRLIHLVGKSLVCRRVDNFAVLWKRDVDPEVDPEQPGVSYTISGDGSRVALALSQAAQNGQPKRFYTEILNGEDGRPIARWPLDRHDDIVLSSDGKLLALAGC